MIQYFNIIQALTRSALINPSGAVLQQVNRLKDAFEKDGFGKEAKSLAAMLSNFELSSEMAPSKIQKSFVVHKGEELKRTTPLPVDKETSTPLAEIYFADDLPMKVPQFDHDIQEAVQGIITEWQMFDQLVEVEALPASSCLIYGAPGTGKTHLAKWLAQQIGLPVVLARLEGLMSSFLGTTSRNIGNLFTFANRYNCVLLLDEFDAIAKLRNDPQEVGEVKRVVNTLLQSLDSRKGKGFTIGITNHESLLDPAIWRRFDIQLEIPVPSPEVMTILLHDFLKPLEFPESTVRFLSWCLEGSSGADAEMFSKWIKRSIVVNGENSIVSVAKKFALLNSGRVNARKRNIMLSKDEDFINALTSDRTYNFKQKEIAPFFGIAPSTVSKQLAKVKDTEKL